MFKTNLNFLLFTTALVFVFLFNGCKNEKTMVPGENSYKIMFLHHSTGHVIWKGETGGIKGLFGKKEAVPSWFANYNKENGTDYFITEQNFPKAQPYGWNNYPFDYYNIWVKNAGDVAFMEEPTLEMLTKEYDLIVFKHCFPVSNIDVDLDTADIDSPEKRLQNYKAQYEAIRDKLREFPENKFILWTAAAHVQSNVTEEEVMRTRDFVEWVIQEWDKPGDNIFLWDFYALETEGGLYLKEEYSARKGDSHPSAKFGERVAPLFASRIVDVIENNGEKTNLKGETK